MSRNISGVKNPNYKHGKSYHPLYIRWKGMKERCYNTNHNSYHNYGARGILMCDEWRDSFESFLNWSISNGYASELTLDRIDNNKGYSPENCRWTDMKVQSNNTRKNVCITFNGETKTLSQWAEQLGGTHYLVAMRLKRGWTVEEALTIPIGEKRRKEDEFDCCYVASTMHSRRSEHLAQERSRSDRSSSSILGALSEGVQKGEAMTGNVPIRVVAKVLGKTDLWVREAIYQQRLNIGTCIVGAHGKRSFYVSPQKLYELTGYMYEGSDDDKAN